MVEFLVVLMVVWINQKHVTLKRSLSNGGIVIPRWTRADVFRRLPLINILIGFKKSSSVN